MYPPTISDVQTRMARFPQLSDGDLASRAINQACGELELNLPAAFISSQLSARLDRAAWAIAMDLIWYYMRAEVERDADGDLPKSVYHLRKVLDARLLQLRTVAAEESGDMEFDIFAPLDPMNAYNIAQGLIPTSPAANNILLPPDSPGYYGDR